MAMDFIDAELGELQELVGNRLWIAGYCRKGGHCLVTGRVVEGDHYVKRPLKISPMALFGCVCKRNPVSEAFRARICQLESVPLVTPSERKVDRLWPPRFNHERDAAVTSIHQSGALEPPMLPIEVDFASMEQARQHFDGLGELGEPGPGGLTEEAVFVASPASSNPQDQPAA